MTVSSSPEVPEDARELMAREEVEDEPTPRDESIDDMLHNQEGIPKPEPEPEPLKEPEPEPEVVPEPELEPEPEEPEPEEPEEEVEPEADEEPPAEEEMISEEEAAAEEELSDAEIMSAAQKALDALGNELSQVEAIKNIQQGQQRQEQPQMQYVLAGYDSAGQPLFRPVQLGQTPMQPTGIPAAQVGQVQQPGQPILPAPAVQGASLYQPQAPGQVPSMEFVTDANYEEMMGNAKGVNNLLNTIVATAHNLIREQTMKEVPLVISSQLAYRRSLEAEALDFFQKNPDLQGSSRILGLFAREVQMRYPTIDTRTLYETAGKATRKFIAEKGGSTEPAAQPEARQRRPQLPRQTGRTVARKQKVTKSITPTEQEIDDMLKFATEGE